MNWAESTRDTRVDQPHHTPEPRAVQERHGIHSGCHYTLTLLPVQAQTVTGGIHIERSHVDTGSSDAMNPYLPQFKVLHDLAESCLVAVSVDSE